MFKVIIIDDEPKSIASIKFVLEKFCNFVSVVETANSVNEAYEKILIHSPDMIFLDVEMPYGNGFELLSKVFINQFEVIFVTAFEDFAVKAFKVDAIDYILKPYTEDDIIAAVKKAVSRIENRKLSHYVLDNSTVKGNRMANRLAVPTFEGFVFLDINQIIRCEADDSYTTFYLMDNRKQLVCKQLSEYELLLSDFGFHRIHKSHLINIQYVQKYVKGRGGFVVMSDGKSLDVSARKKMEFLDHIFK